MAKYVDGFVLVVPDSKVAEYTKMAEEGRNSWMKHGALSYFECKGDDLTKIKKHRDEVNKKVMVEMNEKFKDLKHFSMPFDMQRFAYGGFEVAVEG